MGRVLMKKNRNAKKKIKEIFDKENYHDLDSIFVEENRASLTLEERTMLAELFILRGGAQLEANQHEASLQSFQAAFECCPDNPDLYAKVCNSVISTKVCPENHKFWINAIQKAIELSPGNLDYLLIQADLLTYFGFHFEDFEMMTQATETYQSMRDAMDQLDFGYRGYFYYCWGKCFLLQGKISEEACDYNRAVELFEIAEKLNFHDTLFLCEYGEAILSLNLLIDRPDLLVKARDLFQAALEMDSSLVQVWIQLGICSSRIYYETHMRDDFETAGDAFERAVELDDKVFSAWSHWGHLLLKYGKIQRNTDALHLSSEKFQMANEINPNDPFVMIHWSEAEMNYGAATDQLWFLQEAEKKLKKILVELPNEPHVYFILGTCFNEIGRYFEESSYHQKAIEIFQRGLTLGNENCYIWHGMGFSYYCIGLWNSDTASFEQASRCCARAVEFSPEFIPQVWNDWGMVDMKLAEMTGDDDYYEHAVEKFEKIIEYSSSDLQADWLYNYGCALDFLGDYHQDPAYFEKAIEVLKQVLEIEPDHQPVRYNLALAYSHLGELVQAVEFLKLSIENFAWVAANDPEDDMMWDQFGLALVHLALLLKDPIHPQRTIQLLEEAESRFARAIALGCNHAFYNMACVHSLLGQYDVAMHFIERAEVSKTLPSWGDMMNDEWLEGMRNFAPFREFVAQRTEGFFFDWNN